MTSKIKENIKTVGLGIIGSVVAIVTFVGLCKFAVWFWILLFQ